jgi:threonine synthase
MREGIELACPRCGRRFCPGRLRCPHHDPAPALDVRYAPGVLREQFDPEQRTRADLWRYRPLLPVTGSGPVTLGEGRTPLVSAPGAGDALDVDLALKLDGANPTGAAKDRGSAVVATYAREADHETVACASTGNAAASIAAYAARGDLDCSLFVPEGLPEAKATQPLVCDADVHAVAGGYGDAHDRCREHVVTEGWLDRSAGATPYAPAGARTLGFELADATRQAGATAAADPDWVAVPVGNGGTIAAVYRGWRLFADLGYAPDPPKLLGVQAASSPAVSEALADGDRPGPASDGGTAQVDGEDDSALEQECDPVVETCADSIAVDQPHRVRAACRAVEASDGTVVTVPDEAIRDAIRTLGRTEGIFAEPASAAGVAGVAAARERGVVDPGDAVVAVVTGTGLKDPETAADALRE